MTNIVRQFIDPADVYTSAYISDILQSEDFKVLGAVTRGTIQVDITTGTVNLEMRLSLDAPWVVVRTYSADIIEEIVLGNFLRVDVSASAKVWLGETK